MNHGTLQWAGAARALLAAATIGLGAPSRVAAQADPTRPIDRPALSLQSGDRVRLKVWREPELSGEFAVDETGVVVFPKVGRLDVTRLSPDSLRSLLLAGYQHSLRDPSVEVTLLRRVNVTGAVRSPGLYYVDPTITAEGLLSLAGGVSNEGNRHRIELFSSARPDPLRLQRDARLADIALRSGDRLQVSERSWLARNPAILPAGLTAVAVVFAALIR